MIDLTANFLEWFDEKYSNKELFPGLMRKQIFFCFEKFGDKGGNDGIHLKNICLGKSLDVYFRNYFERSVSSKSYLLDRWMWIQLPWVLIRVCEQVAMVEDVIMSSSTNGSSPGIEEGKWENIEAPLSNSRHASRDASRIGSSEPSTSGTPSNTTSAHSRRRRKADCMKGGTSLKSNKIRDEARAKAEVSKKSANVQKVERLGLQDKQEGTRGKAMSSPIPTSQKRENEDSTFTLGGGLSIALIHDKYLPGRRAFGSDWKALQNEHNDSLVPGDQLNSSKRGGEARMHPNAFCLTSDELEEASLSRQLGKMRDLHDGLTLEIQEKTRRLNNFEQLTAQQELGDMRSSEELAVREEILRALQPRLDKMCQALEYVSRL